MKKIYLLFIMLLFIPKVSALKLSPNAKSSILMEASTGEIIYSYNENEKRAPASMTKMMSLILIMEEIEKGSCAEMLKNGLNANDINNDLAATDINQKIKEVYEKKLKKIGKDAFDKLEKIYKKLKVTTLSFFKK